MSANDEEELAHSERGPSTAHRWRPCPGSVKLSRGLPNTAGIEAAHGTVFHEIAAICVEQRLDPQSFVGFEMEVVPHGMVKFDQQMADKMLAGLDLLWTMADLPGVKMIVEKRVSLEHWVGKGEFGTTDCAIIDVKNRRIIVFDWKYGQGVPVGPVRNDQAILYTLGTWTTFAAGMFEEEILRNGGDINAPWEDDIQVVIIIEQPRAEGGGGVWETTMGDILAEGALIRKDAARTEQDNAPLVPGPKQCQFCLAGKFLVCKEKPKHLLALAGADFDSLEDDLKFSQEPEVRPLSAFTPEQRTQLLLHRSMFEKMFEDLHQQTYNDAEKGRPTPGMKLVPGRSPARAWKDEKKAELLLKAAFGDDAYNRKLLSPTMVEDTVGKMEFLNRYKRLVKEGERKNILVPETDKREAVRSYAADFDGLSDDETAIV